MTTSADPLAVIAGSDTDYSRLGLARDRIQLWEDGARTDDRPGSYEWWYFDAHLDDGAKLVVVFMDKDLSTPQKPLDPTILLNLDLADGRPDREAGGQRHAVLVPVRRRSVRRDVYTPSRLDARPNGRPPGRGQAGRRCVAAL